MSIWMYNKKNLQLSSITSSAMVIGLLFSLTGNLVFGKSKLWVPDSDINWWVWKGGYQIVTLIGGQSNWFSASGLPSRFCKEDVVMASITEPTLANSRGFFKLISNGFGRLKSFNDTIF